MFTGRPEINRLSGEEGFRSSPSWGLLTFLAIGIAMLLTYALMGWFYGDDPHRWDRYTREGFIWPVLGILFALYLGGYRCLKQSLSSHTRFVAIMGLAIGGVALLITPFHSTDIYGYVNRGWQQLAYGANPYTMVIDDLPYWQHDPMFTDHWVNNPCPYGFLFAQLTQGLCFLAQGYLGITILLFKGLNLVAHGLNGLLIWLGARYLNDKRSDRLLYLYLYNPLILLHHISNGHNDILMGFFVLLAGYWMIQKRDFWVVPALTAGVLIKYTAIVLIPLAFIWIVRRQGWKVAVGSGLLAVLLIVATGFPYLGDYAAFPWGKMADNATITHNSLHSVLFNLYKALTDVAANSVPLFSEETRLPVRTALKYLLFTMYGVFFLWVLRKTLCDDNPVQGRHGFTSYVLLLMVGLICVASLKFYPWYLGMFFPLAFLLPETHALQRFIVMFSGFQLLAFTFIGQAHIMNYLLMTGVPLGIAFYQNFKQPSTDPSPPSASPVSFS